jgi:acetolactate synthase small subunit
MSYSHRATRLLGLTSAGRVTFVIHAENRSDVLAGVVQLFHDLNVEVEALYMVRRRGSETLRIHVTIEASQENRQRVQANLYEVVNVRFVKTERATGEVLCESLDEESRGRYR